LKPQLRCKFRDKLLFVPLSQLCACVSFCDLSQTVISFHDTAADIPLDIPLDYRRVQSVFHRTVMNLPGSRVAHRDEEIEKPIKIQSKEFQEREGKKLVKLENLAINIPL